MSKGLFVIIIMMVFFTAPEAAQGIFDRLPPGIDPQSRYLFFLHGQIVEDGGVRPTSERYGTYEYLEILTAFRERGFVVISEPRPKGTKVLEYKDKVAGQIERLLKAGVPQGNITVVGASKGGAIAFFVSAALKRKHIKYVIIACCIGRMAAQTAARGFYLSGDVLSIFDVNDDLFGSCRKFSRASGGKGLKRFEEITLDMGKGHGFHYKPAKEWFEPAVRWALGEP